MLIVFAFTSWYFFWPVGSMVDHTNTGVSTITEPVTTPTSPNASPHSSGAFTKSWTVVKERPNFAGGNRDEIAFNIDMADQHAEPLRLQLSFAQCVFIFNREPIFLTNPIDCNWRYCG